MLEENATEENGFSDRHISTAFRPPLTVIRGVPGSVFDWSGSGELRYWYGTAIFENWGLIRKTGLSTNSLGIYLDNHGTMSVLAGRLRLSGSGTNQSILTVSSQAQLEFATGYGYGDTSSLGGAGTLLFTGGTHDLLGSFDPQGGLEFNGGTITVHTPLVVQQPLSIRCSVSFNRDVSINTLTLEPGGTLKGDGAVTVTNLTWNGGTMSGSGRTIITDTGHGDVAGADTHYLDARALENRGLLELSGEGPILFAGSLWNTSSGTVVQNSAADMIAWYRAAAVTNAGIWNKAFPGTNTIGVPFISQVPLTLTNGVLILAGGGISDSTIDVQASAELRLAGSYNYTENSVLGGLGAISFTGGTHDLKGQFSPRGAVGFGGGTITIYQSIQAGGFVPITNTATVNFNTDQTFGDLLLQGTLGGSGDVTISNQFRWLGGTVNGSGRLLIPPGATFSITNSSEAARFVSRPIENQGTLLHTNGGPVYLSVPFWNRPGGTIRWLGDGDFVYWYGSAALTNDGVILRSGASTNVFTLSVANRGSLSVADGGLRLQGGGTHSGLFTVDTAASLIFEGSSNVFTNGASFGGSGSVRFLSGVNLAAPLNLAGLDAYFEGNASLTGTQLVASGAGGALTFNKPMTVPGSVTVGGRLVFTNTAQTVVIRGTLTMQPGSTLTNYGTLQVGALIGAPGVDFTVVGNAPVVVGSLLLTPFIIDGLHVDHALSGRLFMARVLPGPQTVIEFHGPPGAAIEIQSSRDLITWSPMGVSALETAPGRYRCSFAVPAGSPVFFRVTAE